MTNHLPSGDLEIRPASFNDISSIQDIAAKTWPAAYEPILGKEQVDYMLGLFYSRTALEEQMKNHHYFFLALFNFTPVGFAAFSYVKDITYKLQKLYVINDLQKLGTGRKLLETVETIAKSMGGKKMRLNVNRHNNAKNFYEKQGFEVLYEEDIEIGNGYFMNDYVMGKDLF
jgi:ribosomal protein S18 acetylase RimI-like enzyme